LLHRKTRKTVKLADHIQALLRNAPNALNYHCQTGDHHAIQQDARMRQQAVPKEANMTWKTPRVTEVSCAMEINCYVSAKV
jgi:coenzyme PQQ precursor peptide PqqA